MTLAPSQNYSTRAFVAKPDNANNIRSLIESRSPAESRWGIHVYDNRRPYRRRILRNTRHDASCSFLSFSGVTYDGGDFAQHGREV